MEVLETNLVTPKQFGQERPADTNVATPYTVPTGKRAIIRHIMVANTSSNNTKYRIFMDANGTTHDETTAIAFDVPLSKENTHSFDDQYIVLEEGGSIGVRTGTANNLTFTIDGDEIDV